MARILLAWELGDGLGHVSRLLPIAEELKRLGHECVLAVRDLVSAFPLSGNAGFWVLQAPFVQVPQPRGPIRTGGFGDILALAGFNDAGRLEAIVSGWTDLVAFLRPDLVVADFSPILCLALYSGPLPLIVIGDGFTLPPGDGETFPPFPGLKPVHSEEDLLETVRVVQRRRRRPSPPGLNSIFPKGSSFVVSLPELDPYAARRGAAAIGPLAGEVPQTSEQPIHDWFAYLSLAYPGTEIVIEGLARHPGRGSLYLRDASPAQVGAIRKRGLTVHDRPQELNRATASAKIVVHHGGVGTSQAALMVGRPQLIVPRQLEQRLNAHALGTLGLAVGMARTFDADDFASALSRALSDKDLARNARERSRSIGRRHAPPALGRLISACQSRLGLS